MYKKGGEAVCVGVMTVERTCAVDVFQISFNGDVSDVEAELKLPVAN